MNTRPKSDSILKLITPRASYTFLSLYNNLHASIFQYRSYNIRYLKLVHFFVGSYIYATLFYQFDKVDLEIENSFRIILNISLQINVHGVMTDACHFPRRHHDVPDINYRLPFTSYPCVIMTSCASCRVQGTDALEMHRSLSNYHGR